MSKPDKELIAEVMLYSQGFKQAKQLSKQTVPFSINAPLDSPSKHIMISVCGL
jgi:hypothetical protein